MSSDWLNNKRKEIQNNKRKEIQNRCLGQYPLPRNAPAVSSPFKSPSSITPLSRGKRILQNSQRNFQRRSIVQKLDDQYKNKQQSDLQQSDQADGEDRDEVLEENGGKTANSHVDPVDTNLNREQSWEEVVSAAGGLLFSGNLGQSHDSDGDASHEEDMNVDEHESGTIEQVENASPERRKRKRKTPKESRLAEPKILVDGEKCSKSNRKNFKESFNTDKSRLEKRQPKFKREQNFLLIVQDNIHETGHEQSAKTAGKNMVFGRGPLKQQFIEGGLKYNDDEFYMHKNSYNFTREKIIEDSSAPVRKEAPRKTSNQVISNVSRSKPARQPGIGKYNAMKVSWGAPNLSESESEDDSEEVFDNNVDNNDD